MDIVKLDSYEYDLIDIHTDKGIVKTILYITVDSAIDPSIYDIVNELSVSRRVHVNGRYFTCQDYNVEDHNPSRGGAVLTLYLKEDKKESLNEVS